MQNKKRDFKTIWTNFITFTYYTSTIPLKIYDIVHKTRFSGIEEEKDAGGRYEYYPSPMYSFPSLRRYIRKRLDGGRGHSVLDIGCGKGFILQFFSQLLFDKVSGIDYDAKLCRIAKKNLKKLKLDQRVSVYHCDALNFSNYGDYDIFYLYNPFIEPLLDQCLDAILSSLKDHPRKLTIFYCNPRFGHLLPQKGFRRYYSHFPRTHL